MSGFRKRMITGVATLAVIAATTGAAEAKKKSFWKKALGAIPIVAVLAEPKPLSSRGLAAAIVPPTIAPPAVSKALEKGLSDIASTAEKAAQDTGRTLQKASQDTGDTFVKAARDTGRTIEKAVHDGGDAVVATGKFVERQTAANFKKFEHAWQRIEDGKVFDAAWHFFTDDYKATEKNAFKATQESNIVRVGGQIAATAYGGPGGAAAYASWQAFRQSGGNVEAALKAGIISGLASYASGANVGMASDGAKEIVKKTIMAGAIGGAAVAAAGGSQAEIQDAFVKGTVMAGVQAVFAQVMKEPLNRDSLKASEGQAYCLGASQMNSCTGETKAYTLLSADKGDPVMRAPNEPYLDVRKTVWTRPHVGKWATTADSPWIGLSERSANMIAVSKYPGMNAMAMFHDHVSYVLEFNEFTNVVTIVPATVFTYYGTESPIMEAIRKADEAKRGREAAKRKSEDGALMAPV